jgi:hypothetical protein
MITTLFNRSGYLCTIKNDEAGKNFIELLREQLADVGKHVKLRGHGHRRGIRRYRQDLPISLASHVALYLY